MVNLIKRTNVYEDEKGKFETNMELQFIITRPGKERQFWFTNPNGYDVVLVECEEYKDGENYVKWNVE